MKNALRSWKPTLVLKKKKIWVAWHLIWKGISLRLPAREEVWTVFSQRLILVVDSPKCYFVYIPTECIESGLIG